LFFRHIVGLQGRSMVPLSPWTESRSLPPSVLSASLIMALCASRSSSLWGFVPGKSREVLGAMAILQEVTSAEQIVRAAVGSRRPESKLLGSEAAVTPPGAAGEAHRRRLSHCHNRRARGPRQLVIERVAIGLCICVGYPRWRSPPGRRVFLLPVDYRAASGWALPDVSIGRGCG
jgi:hypothetical protein